MSSKQGETTLANNFFGNIPNFNLVCIGCMDGFGCKRRSTYNYIDGGEFIGLEGESRIEAGVVSTIYVCSYVRRC